MNQTGSAQFQVGQRNPDPTVAGADSWPAMAHVAAAAATGHQDYCRCAGCDNYRRRYVEGCPACGSDDAEHTPGEGCS